MIRLVIIISIIFFASNCWAETLSLLKNKIGEKEEIINQEKPTQLTLKRAINIAMQDNNRVKSAIATLPITETQLIIAKYIPNPFLVSTKEFIKGGATHPSDIGQSLELGRKRYWRVKVAKEQISKTELEIAKVLWEVHTQVHSAYATFAVNQDFINLAKQRVDFYNGLLDVTKARYDAGDISGLEVTRAETELLRAENDLKSTEKRLKKARIDFNHLLARDPAQEVDLQGTEELKPKVKLQEHLELKNIVEDALNKRLEVAILEKQFGIARAQLKKSEWERLPSLLLTAGPVAINGAGWGADIDAQIDLPIFNRKQGEIKQAKAQIEYLEKERERIQNDIKAEVANAYKDLEISEEQVKNFQEKLLTKSEDVLEMIKFAYEKGEITLTDVLNAEQQNRQVIESYLTSLLNYQIDLASLEYAVGVPLYQLGEK